MSKKQVDISVMLLISIAVIVTAGIVFSVILFSRDPIETELNDEHVFNTLFVLEDNKKPIGAYVVLFIR
ncbi:hypothetical protein AGMMS50212_17160 [Spirochaetia bacterium]|nr:hypothetical protein AGMMS50212_17160 [Spirochaetia bacterium]